MVNLDLYRERVEELISQLTTEEKVNLMCQYQDSVERLGIKPYKHGTEASHGVAWLGEATMFPQPIGLASLWDRSLMKKIGTVIGTEARGYFAKDPDKNGLTLWAPTIDLNRDSRWGRTDEGYGEDPILVASLTSALIKGMQGCDETEYRCVPTLKHLYGNNNEINRGSCSTNISERIKREYYLKVFELVIKESGVLSLMTAYNEVNNIPANVDPDIQKIIRDEWKWPGFIVSDAGDVLSLIKEHNYAETPEEAVTLSIKAGIDSITDDHEVCKKAIIDGLKSGGLTENDMDRALKRTFLIRHVLGEFNENSPYAGIGEDVIGKETHGQVSLEAAEKSIVLLKNSDKTLPIEDKTNSIAVVGNLADRIYRDWYSGEFLYRVTPDMALKEYYNSVEHYHGNDIVTIRDNNSGLFIGLDGKLTETPVTFELEEWGWGAVTFRSTESRKYLSCDENIVKAQSDDIWGWFTKEVFYTKPEKNVQIKSWNNANLIIDKDQLCFRDSGESDGEFGITASTPLNPIYVEEGNFSIEVVESGLDRVLDLVKSVDTPLLCIGNHPLINGKETIDRHDITLPERQKKLALEVIKANPNAVLILTGSYPYALEELNDKYSTILYSSHLGQESANAITNVISGKVNPAGRLPMTWYKSSKDLGDIMNYELPECEKTYLYNKKPVDYAFGHGLSYTHFDYTDLKLKKSSISPDDKIEFSMVLKNIGEFDGEEVIQIYLSHNGTAVKYPIKQLADYKRVNLNVGEQRRLEFSITTRELHYWCEESNCFKLEPGEAKLLVGSSSEDIRLEAQLNLI